MPIQRVGVRAEFDVTAFNAGLKTYLDGLAKAEAATNRFTQVASNLGGIIANALGSAGANLQATAQGYNQLTQSIQAATTAARQQATAQASQTLQQQARYAALLKQELRDVLVERRANATMALREATAYQRAAAALDLQNVAARRDVRRAEVTNLGFNLNDFDALRRVQTEVRDLGRNTYDTIVKQSKVERLVTQEVADRIKEERARLTLMNQQATALDRMRAQMELLGISTRRMARDMKAADLGNSSVLLQQARTAPVTREDLGFKPVSVEVAENLLNINRIISAELNDQVESERLKAQLADNTLTAVERQRAALEQQNIALRRGVREAQALEAGLSATRLQQIRSMTVQDRDIGKSATEQLDKQLRISSLLGQELSERIAEERERLVLASRTASVYERQAAALRLQQIQQARQRRDVDFTDLGVDARRVQDIRNMRVAMRDLQNTSSQTAQKFQQVRTSAIAMGTALGQASVQAVQSLINTMSMLGRQLLENVRFFERFDLSVQFFTGRALRGADATISYADSLELGAERARELTIWLQNLAVASPFTTKDVATIFRTAQAYGLTLAEAPRLLPVLLDFASAAGLSNEIMERLALALGQVRARGKLTGEEIRQLGNSALPVRDILVKALGIANDEFDKLVESGTLTSNITIPALVKAMKEFEGAGETIANKTITGLIASFQDLAEISSTRFFLNLLEPFRAGVESLFGLLRDQRNLAYAEVLGKEIGVRLKAGLDAAVKSIQGFIKAWNGVDPLIKRQIVLFGVAFVAIMTLIGAVGLFIAVLGLLSNPLVQLGIGLAFLISEWGTGFQNLSKIGKAFQVRMAAVATGVAKAWARTAEFFADMTVDVSTAFAEMTKAASNWATGFVKSFAGGIIGASYVIAETAKMFGNIFEYWLKPGSPPRVAPDLDDWGLETAYSWIGGLNKGFSEIDFTPLSTALEAQLRETRRVQDQAARYLLENSPVGITPIRDDLFTGRRGAIVDQPGLAQSLGLAQPAVEEAAQNLGESAANAFLEGWNLPQPNRVISEELQKILDQIGGGPQLGRGDIQPFINASSLFNLDDFSGFGEIISSASELLSVFNNLGDLTDADLIRTIFGTRTELAEAIAEFRTVGTISQSTINSIAQAAGPAGQQIRDLVTAYIPLATVTDRLNSLQDELNSTTSYYNDILEPIKTELKEIQDIRSGYDEQLEIQSLQRTINNEAVSEFRREQARARIREIQLGAQVRGIENERDARVDVINEEIELARIEQERLQDSYDLLREQIAARAEQLGLVADEQEFYRQLEEEAQKIRDKQKSDLELQLELLKLQQAEMRDTVTLAKARYTLASGESSELDKHNALLDIANVELSRQQRILDAMELGFGPEDLTFLYDLPVTLKDMGIKEAVDDLFGGVGDAIDNNEKEIAETARKFNESLAEATQAVEDFITRTRTALIEINENLPQFLQFLSTGEEEAPIIKTLQNLAIAMGALGAVIAVFSVAKNILAVAASIATLKAAAGVGGGAAAAGAAGAGGGGVGAFLTGVALSMARFVRWAGPFVAIAGLVAEGLHLIYRSVENQAAIETDFAVEQFELPQQALDQALSLDQIEIPTEFPPELRQQLRDILTQAATEEGAFAEQLFFQIGQAINAGVGAGVVDPDLSAAVDTFYTQLETLFAEAAEIQSPSRRFAESIGVPIGLGIVDGIKDTFAETGVGGVFEQIMEAITIPFMDAVEDVADIATDLRTKLINRFTLIRASVLVRTKLIAEDTTDKFDEMSDTVTDRLETLRIDMNDQWTRAKTATNTLVTGLRTDTVGTLNGLAMDIFAVMARISDSIVQAFVTAKEQSLIEIARMSEAVLDLFGAGEGATTGLLPDMTLALQTAGLTIGEAFVDGIAEGIQTERSRKVLSDALTSAIQQGFYTAAEVLEIASPSKRAAREIGEPWALGIAQGVMGSMNRINNAGRKAAESLFGALSPVSSLYTPNTLSSPAGSVSNISRINNYTLNVSSERSSQGIISDFAILKASAF